MAPGLAQAVETAHRIELQLDQAVPNWRAIAADPQWARWLNAANPATGRVRREQFNDAVERGDARDVVAMLQRFLQEQREGWPIREISQGLEPRAAVASYTREQIREFYERHRKGEITGADRNRLEADFIRAAREGRISNPLPLTKNWADGR